MTTESTPSGRTGTKLTEYWYRFWVNGRVFEHIMNSPKLSVADISAKFSKRGFTPLASEHIKIGNNIHSVVAEPFESPLIDVTIDHPLYNKLYS